MSAERRAKLRLAKVVEVSVAASAAYYRACMRAQRPRGSKRRTRRVPAAELRSQSCEAMDTTSPPGQKWAANLVVSRVRAAGIEEDEKDMRKRVTRGRPDAKVRKLMAASSTAQPPGVVKTLTDDKKRKRPVKKRRGKKLTVAESEAESESEAEAEAARSSKRRVPRARKNKNKQ
eukprot:jgi/Tetstr1/427578/TSEL_017704.t1